MYLSQEYIHALLHTITVTTCKVVYVMLCVATPTIFVLITTTRVFSTIASLCTYLVVRTGF